MLQQALPPSAVEYGREQRREIGQAVAAARRAWRRMGPDFDASWVRVGPRLLEIAQLAQERVATGALAYVPAVLEETGQVRSIDTMAPTRPDPLVGVAGDGRPVDTLLYGAVTHAKTKVAGGASTAQALRSAQSWLSMTTGTLLSDTARQGESLGMGVRPVSGYVRMLTPPSCSRCVILAGKYYRKSTGFQRHPGCDCRHIPASESVADDLTVDSRAYVASLDEAELDAFLGKAGADAFRAGGDLEQIVNARRGMATAQIGGRSVLVTREGMSRRGFARRRMERAAPGRRQVRLMPESIARIATDRDDYLRLLRANGYII